MEPQFEPQMGRPGPAPKADDVRWVQRMALAIAGRTAAADDLVQEAWLVALHAEVELSGERRGWWFATMRNLQRRQRRSDSRRSDREQRREPPRAAAPSAEEVCLRAEAQQRIAGAALRLEEPLRSTLLLRFFDGVSAPDIARQQGVQVDTVRARLRRAIKLLQADLDRGEDSGWKSDLAMALPLGFSLKTVSAGASAGTSVGTSVFSFLGGSLMLGKASFAIGLIAAVAITAWLALLPRFAGLPDELILSQSPVQVEAAPQEPLQPLELEEPRTRFDLSEARPVLTAGQRTPSPLVDESPAECLIEGSITLLLPDGRRMTDATGSFVLSQPPERKGASDNFSCSVDFRSGRFEASVPASMGLMARDFIVTGPGPMRRSMKDVVWTDPVQGGSAPRKSLELMVAVEAIATLDVSESKTGDPLGGLVVIVGPEAWSLPPYMEDSGRDGRVVAQGASRLKIPLRDFAGEEVDLWVGGEGRGWKSCTVPTSADSETRLSLASGGELELRFRTPLPDGCKISLHRRDHQPKIRVDMGDDWHGVLDATAQHVMTGVIPGSYDVLVEFAPSHAGWPFTREIASRRVKVEAGERTVVELDGVILDDQEPRADVTIELRVAPQWNAEECFLRLSPLSAGWETKRRQWTEVDLEFDSEGLAVVAAADVVVGTYLLEFFALNLLAQSARVEVSAGETALEVTVPDPTELRLWVVDAGSGANLDVTSLTIGPPTLEGAQGRTTPMNIPKRGPTGALVLRVPGGQQELRLRVEDGRRVARTLHITQNPTEVVIEVPN